MKAQAWSTDFVGSVVIFFISVMLIMFIWNHSVYTNTQQTVLNEMSGLTIRITDTLVRTGGLPAEWNLSTVRLAGLASGENVLNTTKVDFLTSMDYQALKEKLNTLGRDFYLDIRYVNSTLAGNSSGHPVQVGLYPSGASAIIPVERYVLYGGSPAKMRFMLWY
jgi:hypothetical protein